MIIPYLNQCIENAERGESRLNPEILKINGMSSPKIRHLINNICSYPDFKRYLEVGTWRGSTLLSAANGNKNIELAVGIDDFSQFVEPHPHTKEWLYCTPYQD